MVIAITENKQKTVTAISDLSHTLAIAISGGLAEDHFFYGGYYFGEVGLYLQALADGGDAVEHGSVLAVELSTNSRRREIGVFMT